MTNLSRGASEVLKRLEWYGRRYGRIHPTQKKLACGLRISERQLRTYLRELRIEGYISVSQGGDGRAACYTIISELASALNSRLFPGCSAVQGADVSDAHEVGEQNFRAEPTQYSSLGSGCSNQSECRSVEAPRPISISEPGEPREGTADADYRHAQREAVKRHIEATGIRATDVLLEKLSRKAKHFGVTGFQVAAAIARAYKRIAAQPSNHPRSEGWILKAVETELAASPEFQSSPWPLRSRNPSAPMSPATRTLTPVSLATCTLCEGSGLIYTPQADEHWRWCECGSAAERRVREPDAVKVANEAVARLLKLSHKPEITESEERSIPECYLANRKVLTQVRDAILHDPRSRKQR